MISEALLGRLRGASPVQVDAADLEHILETSVLIREENTGIAGMMRVLDLGGEIFVQETTHDGLFLVRPRPGVDEALAFVAGRLLSYEKMWDG